MSVISIFISCRPGFESSQAHFYVFFMIYLGYTVIYLSLDCDTQKEN